MHSSGCCSRQGQPALLHGVNIWCASRRIAGGSALRMPASPPEGGLLRYNRILQVFRIYRTP
ncbi:hypothetical protein C5K18_21370, partial [Shigella dysenteriae]